MSTDEAVGVNALDLPNKPAQPAPAFDCDQCGRRIGKPRPHFILDDNRVICVRHHDEHYDACRIKYSFCSRAACARLLLGVWP